MEISETSKDYSDILSILDQSVLITTVIQVISLLLSFVTVKYIARILCGQ